jgi:hypothetical protein
LNLRMTIQVSADQLTPASLAATQSASELPEINLRLFNYQPTYPLGGVAES